MAFFMNFPPVRLNVSTIQLLLPAPEKARLKMYLHHRKQRIRSGLYIPGEIALRRITVPGAAAARLAAEARAMKVAATVLPCASRWTNAPQIGQYRGEYRGRGKEFRRGWLWTHRAIWSAS
jgi:hypothetical protein